MSKPQYYNDWEELAKLDPKWAILTAPNTLYGYWNDSEFFKTGHDEIEEFFQKIQQHNITIENSEALDFGCGMGRLTRPLSNHFKAVSGVDISDHMIALAKELHPTDKFQFHLNNKEDLSLFPDNKFSLVYTSITLQHIPDREVIEKYIREFFRVLKPGGYLYFQLPARTNYHNDLKRKLLKIRGAAYHAMNKLGIPKRFTFNLLGFKPFMHGSFIPTSEITDLIKPYAEVIYIEGPDTGSASYLLKKYTP